MLDDHLNQCVESLVFLQNRTNKLVTQVFEVRLEELQSHKQLFRKDIGVVQALLLEQSQDLLYVVRVDQAERIIFDQRVYCLWVDLFKLSYSCLIISIT